MGDNFKIIFQEFLKIIYSPLNRLLILAVSAQVASMICKLIISSIKSKSFNYKKMATYGGMPSSHTVFVMSILFGIGLDKNLGWQSELFAVVLVFSMITIVDTIRLRSVIDRIKKSVDDIAEKENLKVKLELPKDIAHTVPEVVVGIFFAFIYTFVFYLFFYHLF